MTRVWLPDSPEAFGGLPAGLEADVWKGGEELPPSADEVEFVVFPVRHKILKYCEKSSPCRG